MIFVFSEYSYLIMLFVRVCFIVVYVWGGGGGICTITFLLFILNIVNDVLYSIFYLFGLELRIYKFLLD